jgi:hypothetical protein
MPAATQQTAMDVGIGVTARSGNIFTCVNTKGLVLRGAVTFSASPVPLISGYSTNKLFGSVLPKKIYYIFLSGTKRMAFVYFV